ncbi:hypothetical protein [Cedecea sp. NFIX57]|uniref:hypothetical protein n=1 Tax=Cedecea sp. NFIX57 TaxID=1566286 RepID=UPI00111C2D4B|nr:hypothetical protein [Cedecea sp. NFIX57]
MEGTTVPLALMLIAAVAGDAAVRVGAELPAEANGGPRVNRKLVGMVAGLGAVASLNGSGTRRSAP